MKNKQLKNVADSSPLSLVKTRIFGVDITNERLEKVLEFSLSSFEKSEKKYYIVTPNPEMIVYAAKHDSFKNILNQAQIALCDGMQLFRAAAFLGTPIKERITGVFFMEKLCKVVSRKPITVGFLGGRDGVAMNTAERLRKKYPGLTVVFVGEEPEALERFQLKIDSGKLKKNDKSNSSSLSLSKKEAAHIDILFVAFGFPKQEEWMCKNLSNYNITVMMGVGGAFDYLSGRVQRAPVWMQRLGFEWLYRLICQPWRWRRQLALIEFVGMVMKEKFVNNGQGTIDNG